MKSVRLIVGAVAVVLAFIPGLPALPFLVLAILLLGSTLLVETEKENDTAQQEPLFQPKPPAVLQVEINEQLTQYLISASELSRTLEDCRQKSFNHWGLIIAVPELVACKDSESAIRIKLRGSTMSSQTITGQQTNLNPLVGEMLLTVINQYTCELVDDILTRRTLDFFDRQAPELVSAVVPEMATVTQITTILRSLIKEGIAIKNFDLIMQAIAEAGQKCQGDRQLLQEVRIALRRTICDKYCQSGNLLNCVAVDPVLDMALSKAECNSALIDPQQITPIVEYLRKNPDTTAVLIVSKTARLLLRDCLDLYRFTIPVIAHEEIVEQVKLNLVGEINIHNTESSVRILEQLAA
jgi:flagellar biosynthesis component FlhA